MMKIMSICLIFFFLIVGMSCTSKYAHPSVFEEEQLGKIQSGKTTKQEILQWFGPPRAAARKSDERKITGTEETGKERFGLGFDVFTPKHEITDDHIIYYYSDLEIKTTVFVVVSVPLELRKRNEEKLWILINDKTGIVEDYVLQRSSEHIRNN